MEDLAALTILIEDNTAIKGGSFPNAYVSPIYTRPRAMAGSFVGASYAQVVIVPNFRDRDDDNDGRLDDQDRRQYGTDGGLGGSYNPY